MFSSQPIINPLSNAAIFLVLTINEGKEQEVRDVLADFLDLIKTVSFRVPEDGINAVIGIGSLAWDRLFQGVKPKNLHPFPELKGNKYAPSTPGDILLHVRSSNHGSAYELVRIILDRFRDSVSIEDEVNGFHYFDQRDLLGFVDGTANPEGDDAKKAVFLDDDKDIFKLGSYVYIQKYIHDMKAWNNLTIEEQEAAIGRSKVENVEFPDEKKATNAHIVLNTIKDADGKELDIYRANMPFANLKEGITGTFYIAYASNPSVIEQMLHNMFIGNPKGNTDRILDFSQAITGSAFFVPPYDFLDNLPQLPSN